MFDMKSLMMVSLYINMHKIQIEFHFYFFWLICFWFNEVFMVFIKYFLYIKIGFKMNFQPKKLDYGLTPSRVNTLSISFFFSKNKKWITCCFSSYKDRNVRTCLRPIRLNFFQGLDVLGHWGSLAWHDFFFIILSFNIKFLLFFNFIF
jgi:hypothetical protein